MSLKTKFLQFLLRKLMGRTRIARNPVLHMAKGLLLVWLESTLVKVQRGRPYRTEGRSFKRSRY